MTLKAGIGVAGCGLRAAAVLKPLLSRGDGVAVRAVYDPDPSAPERLASRLDAAPRRAESYAALLADPEVDWVFIFSWNCFHAEQAVAALAAGKHVFCEKPLGVTFEQCRDVVLAHRRAGTRFAIGFTLRYSPFYRRVKELLPEAAGRLVSLEFNELLAFNHGGHIHSGWRRRARNSGGHITEKCSHDFDMANWMTGGRPVRAASFGGTGWFRPENAAAARELRPSARGVQPYRAWWRPEEDRVDPFGGDNDVVDHQVAILEYDNGVRASFHTNCNAGIPERRLAVCGGAGGMRADLCRMTIETRRIGFDEWLRVESSDDRDGHGGGDEVMGAELYAAMTAGAPLSAGLEEAYAATVTGLAIERAMRTGTVVEVPGWPV